MSKRNVVIAYVVVLGWNYCSRIGCDGRLPVRSYEKFIVWLLGNVSSAIIVVSV